MVSKAWLKYMIRGGGVQKLKAVILKCLPPRLLRYVKGRHYVKSLQRYSEKDEPDIAVMKHLVSCGDVVVDIGANVGWYTKVLSGLVGVEGRVYSVEPIPATFELLSYCVSKLGLENVELINCGMSDKDGVAVMEIPLYETGVENYYKAQIVTKEIEGKGLNHHKIKLRSIDSLFGDVLERISFIKCDVEGHEYHVIGGASMLLKDFKPAWLMEISGDVDDERSSANKIFASLEQKGYSAWWYDGERLKRRSPGESSVNYFFLTSQHISRLRLSNVRLVS